MEIRTFAEQVLFSRTLTEKLLVPGRLTDAHPGPAIGTVSMPERPPGLEFGSSKRGRGAFPKVSELDDEQARGRILHFFANHELLALELMALTLLRFPDAPSQFRKRLVATIRDEQKHMSLYLRRMRELGVQFGDVPLNAFFWEQLSTVPNPLRFVAGMSLTFEQANLDFSLFYRDAFRRLGDHITGDIMDEVLRDEIAHVRHGVHLFNQWRAPGLSQWEAYKDALQFPLTPARAKGTIFTKSHRLKAGLDEDFIRNLEVYSHSRGRRPDVMVFNADFEANLALGGSSYTLPKRALALVEDLENIPMFLASQDDVVLTSATPNATFLSGLKALGYPIPEFVEFNRRHGSLPQSCSLRTRQIASCAPWGWDPQVSRLLQPLANDEAGAGAVFTERAHDWAPFASKSWLATHFTRWLAGVPESWLEHCVTTPQPAVLETTSAVLQYHRRSVQNGQRRLILKAPLGSAGRGAVRIDSTDLDARATRWVERTIATQGSVLAEPWYDRVLDFSYLFQVDGDGQLREVGFNRFMTDGHGRYRGSILAPLKRCIPDALKPFFFQSAETPDWLWETVRIVAKNIATELKRAGFQSRAGIDLMVIRAPNGKLKLRVPLELNPRPTMGHVAQALARPLRTQATGAWLLVTDRDCSRSGHGDFTSLVEALSRRVPNQMTSDGRGLRRGVFATNDPVSAKQVCGLALVTQNLDETRSALMDVGLNAEW